MLKVALKILHIESTENTNSSQEMKTTDRKSDLYLQTKQKIKQEEKEKENEAYIKNLEEGLLNEYKYYKIRKDGSGFSAELLMQEAANRTLDQVKER